VFEEGSLALRVPVVICDAVIIFVLPLLDDGIAIGEFEESVSRRAAACTIPEKNTTGRPCYSNAVAVLLEGRPKSEVTVGFLNLLSMTSR